MNKKKNQHISDAFVSQFFFASLLVEHIKIHKILSWYWILNGSIAHAKIFHSSFLSLAYSAHVVLAEQEYCAKFITSLLLNVKAQSIVSLFSYWLFCFLMLLYYISEGWGKFSVKFVTLGDNFCLFEFFALFGKYCCSVFNCCSVFQLLLSFLIVAQFCSCCSVF